MTAMHRLLPAPWLSALVFALWLAANQSLAVGHVLIAVALALIVPPLTLAFRPTRARFRRLSVALELAVIVLWDIVLSNIQLARLILGREARLRPQFVWIPLALKDEHAIITLAGIITMTPGTLSCDVSDDRRHLLVHSFSTEDAAALAAGIKARYETRLQAIFE
ncbi:MAG: Na+/H+ antiporter subunit E [Casimicrobiaceae bacterium]|nr:Na+/H+ antiporter subunit E [Casimicrobiaceae bacterium]